jgi:hypothetical protein
MELVLTNKNGQSLDLLNNDNRFILTDCDALHGIDTDIQTTELPYLDGVEIGNVKALPRGISMTFKLVPDIRESIDFFTSIVKSKQQVTLRESEGGRDISINGIATIPPYSRMMSACEIKLDLYCGQPYWEDVQSVVTAISLAIDLLNFPSEGQWFASVGRPFGVIDKSLEKTFYNDGDTSVGMVIRITALGNVVNPRISCSTGGQNGWYMEFSSAIGENDEIEISTTRGKKYVKVNGKDSFNGTPCLYYMKFVGNDWLQLETGYNTFNVSAKSGEQNVFFTISYSRRYE